MTRRPTTLLMLSDTRHDMPPAMLTPRTAVTRHCVLRFTVCIAAIALVALAPSQMQAQAPRIASTSADTRSRDAASRRVGDSLTVHRLRRPKAKTVAPTTTQQKRGGIINPAHDRTVVETPLPVKTRQRSVTP